MQDYNLILMADYKGETPLDVAIQSNNIKAIY